MPTHTSIDPRVHVAAWLARVPRRTTRVELAIGRESLAEWAIGAKGHQLDGELAAELVDQADAAAALSGRELHFVARAIGPDPERTVVLTFRAQPPAEAAPARDAEAEVSKALMEHVKALTKQNHDMAETLVKAVRSVTETQGAVLGALTTRVAEAEGGRKSAELFARDAEKLATDAVVAAETAQRESRGGKLQEMLFEAVRPVIQEYARKFLPTEEEPPAKAVGDGTEGPTLRVVPPPPEGP